MIESGRLNFILMDRKNLFVSDKKENKFVAELEVKQGNYEVEHYIIEACGNYPKAIELLKEILESDTWQDGMRSSDFFTDKQIKEFLKQIEND